MATRGRGEEDCRGFGLVMFRRGICRITRSLPPPSLFRRPSFATSAQGHHPDTYGPPKSPQDRLQGRAGAGPSRYLSFPLGALTCCDSLPLASLQGNGDQQGIISTRFTSCDLPFACLLCREGEKRPPAPRDVVGGAPPMAPPLARAMGRVFIRNADCSHSFGEGERLACAVICFRLNSEEYVCA